MSKLFEDVMKKASEIVSREIKEAVNKEEYTLINMKNMQTLIPVPKDMNHKIYRSDFFKKLEDFFGKVYAIRIVEFLVRNLKRHKEEKMSRIVSENCVDCEVMSINFMILREEIMRIFSIEKDGIKGHEYLAKLLGRVDFYEDNGYVRKTYKIKKHKNENGYTYPYLMKKELIDLITSLTVEDFDYYRIDTVRLARTFNKKAQNYSEFVEWIKTFPKIDRFYFYGKIWEEYGNPLNLKINLSYIFNIVDNMKISKNLKKFYKDIIKEIVKRDRDIVKLKRAANGRYVTGMSLLPREIRHILLSGFEEYDIKASSQTFLSEYAEIKNICNYYNEYRYNAMKDYLENKEKYRNEIDKYFSEKLGKKINGIGKKILNIIVGMIDSRKTFKDNLYSLKKLIVSEIKNWDIASEFVLKIMIGQNEYYKKYKEEKPKIFRFLKSYIIQLRRIHKEIIKKPVLTGYGDIIDNLTSFANLIEANVLADSIKKELHTVRFIWVYDAIYFPKKMTIEEQKEIDNFMKSINTYKNIIKGLFYIPKIEFETKSIEIDNIQKLELEWWN